MGKQEGNNPRRTPAIPNEIVLTVRVNAEVDRMIILDEHSLRFPNAQGTLRVRAGDRTSVRGPSRRAGCRGIRDGVRRRRHWGLRTHEGSRKRPTGRFYRVPTYLMRPTFHAGQVVGIENSPEEIQIGDVVIFHPPRTSMATAVRRGTR
jgi:hypothetical protein